MERVHVSFETQKVRDAARSAARELGYHDLKPGSFVVCLLYSQRGMGKALPLHAYLFCV